MIFISTGSRSFQFERLLKAVDEAVEKGLIRERIYAQTGPCSYKIKHFEHTNFMDHEAFNDKLDQCDVVLTHGGTGVILNALKREKRVIAVPRLARYGEVVDDHQLQLIGELEKQGLITACYECTPEGLADALERAWQKEIKPYQSNTQKLLDSIDENILESVWKKRAKAGRTGAVTLKQGSTGENTTEKNKRAKKSGEKDIEEKKAAEKNTEQPKKQKDPSSATAETSKVCSNRKNVRVLMCASDRREKGGMNTVVDQLLDHEWDENIKILWVPTHVTGNPVKKVLYFENAYRRIGKMIRRDEFDVAHLHMACRGSFRRKYRIACLCKEHGKKVIIHLHGSEFRDFYRSGDDALKKKIVHLFTIADVTIALGESWRDFLLSIAPEANVVVVHNAIALPERRERKAHTPRTFLFLGALIPRKGVADLLKAAVQLRKEKITDFRLVIAGDGEEAPALKKFAAEQGLKECTDFVGWISGKRKEEYLEKADVLVLPSHNEGLPMAILEAMSYGLPVISTRVGSIAEAVTNGKNGFLFEPDDVDALTNCMKTMIREEETWRKASLASRRICEEKFDDQVFYRKIQKLYEDVI